MRTPRRRCRRSRSSSGQPPPAPRAGCDKLERGPIGRRALTSRHAALACVEPTRPPVASRFRARVLAVDAGGAPLQLNRASCRRLLARAFKGARERLKAAKGLQGIKQQKDDAMKLNSALAERTQSQFDAQAIPENHPVVGQLNSLFGDHTFFLDAQGLNIVEPAGNADSGQKTAQVVKLAAWSDGDAHLARPARAGSARSGGRARAGARQRGLIPPESFRGASEASEPGIQSNTATPRLVALDSGPAALRRPGMTKMNKKQRAAVNVHRRP